MLNSIVLFLVAPESEFTHYLHYPISLVLRTSRLRFRRHDLRTLTSRTRSRQRTATTNFVCRWLVHHEFKLTGDPLRITRYARDDLRLRHTSPLGSFESHVIDDELRTADFSNSRFVSLVSTFTALPLAGNFAGSPASRRCTANKVHTKVTNEFPPIFVHDWYIVHK